MSPHFTDINSAAPATHSAVPVAALWRVDTAASHHGSAVFSRGRSAWKATATSPAITASWITLSISGFGCPG